MLRQEDDQMDWNEEDDHILNQRKHEQETILWEIFLATNGSNWKTMPMFLQGGLRMRDLMDTSRYRAIQQPSDFSTYLPTPLIYSLRTLDLHGMNLKGPFPEMVTKLSALNNLDLRGNQLSGSIPSTLSSISTLVELNLGANQLSGLIPSSIGTLVNLVGLDVSKNKLIGTIPDSFRGLTALQYIKVEYNQLTGEIPDSLQECTSLVHLNVAYNQLTGPIPSVCNAWIQLRTLDVACNRLSGSIPSTLSSLTVMRQFNIGGNPITGLIPSTLMMLPNLYCINIEGTDLVGCFPPVGRWFSRRVDEVVSPNFICIPFPRHVSGCIPYHLLPERCLCCCSSRLNIRYEGNQYLVNPYVDPYLRQFHHRPGRRTYYHIRNTSLWKYQQREEPTSNLNSDGSPITNIERVNIVWVHGAIWDFEHFGVHRIR